MKISVFLRFLGAIVMLGTFVLWASGGFNLGWTKNKVEVREVDPITEIEAIRYEDTFIAGIEVLAGGVLVGSALCLIGVFFRPKKKKLR
jgi:hypothetical protein